MATTAEKDVRNYQVDNETEEQFYNIATFVKNLTLKNSKVYDDAETSESKYFGALLLKYIERSLSDGDIDKLITFTNNYNTLYDSMSNIRINDNGRVENTIMENPEDEDIKDIIKNRINSLLIRIKTWGMYSGYQFDNIGKKFIIEPLQAQPYENSLLNIAILSMLSLDPEYENKRGKVLSNFKNELTAFLLDEFFFRKPNGDNKNDFLSLYVGRKSDVEDLTNEYSFYYRGEDAYLGDQYLNADKNIISLLRKDDIENDSINLFNDVTIGLSLLTNNGGKIESSSGKYFPIMKESVDHELTYKLHKVKIYTPNEDLSNRYETLTDMYAYIKTDKLFYLSKGDILKNSDKEFIFDGSSFVDSKGKPIPDINDLIKYDSIYRDHKYRYRYSGYGNMFYAIDYQPYHYVKKSYLFDFDKNGGYFNFISIDLLELFTNSEFEGKPSIITNFNNILGTTNFKLPNTINKTPLGFSFSLRIENTLYSREDIVERTFRLKNTEGNNYNILYVLDPSYKNGFDEDTDDNNFSIVGNLDVVYDDNEPISIKINNFSIANRYRCMNDMFKKIETKETEDKKTYFISSIDSPIECNIKKIMEDESNISDYTLINNNGDIIDVTFKIFISNIENAIRFKSRNNKYGLKVANNEARNVDPNNIIIEKSSFLNFKSKREFEYSNFKVYTSNYNSADFLDKKIYIDADKANAGEAYNITIKTSNIGDYVLENLKNFSNEFFKVGSTFKNNFSSDEVPQLNFYIHLNNAARTLILKERIIIKEQESDIRKDKYKASESEKAIIANGTPLLFFDIHKNKKSYFIQYKEFNPKYRVLLESDINDAALWEQPNFSSGSFKFLFDNIFEMRNMNSSATTFLQQTMDYYFRNSKDSAILIRDFNLGKPTIQETSKSFKYAYTNAYLARKACESEIIKYYISEPYKQNGYGKFTYEKEEIYKFLEIYEQTRDYFYKVLLNESFINETEYNLYEKFFLSTWAIERYLSSKIESIKDIDSFSLRDIKNFLSSYGLSDLSDIIDLQDFYGSEELSKNLIKRYIDLVQNKGSRKVIDVLEEVFKIPDGALKIYKSFLMKHKLDIIGKDVYFYHTENDKEKLYWNGVTLSKFKFLKDKETQKEIETTNYALGGKRWYWTGEGFYNSTGGDKSIAELGEGLGYTISGFDFKLKNEIVVKNERNENVLCQYNKRTYKENGFDITINEFKNDSESISVEIKQDMLVDLVVYKRKDTEIKTEKAFCDIDADGNIRFIFLSDVNNYGNIIIPKLNNVITIEENDSETYYYWDGTSSFVRVEDNLNYIFINSEYSVDNVFKEINNNLDTAVSIGTYVEEDNYWDFENTKPEYLNQFEIEIENTKYLIPEYVSEMSNSYYITRCVFSALDFLSERTMGLDSFDLNFQSELFSDELEISIFEYLSVIRKAFSVYLDRSDNYASYRSDNIFRMNGIFDSSFNEKYKKYYIIDGGDSKSITVNKEVLYQEFANRNKSNKNYSNLLIDILEGILFNLIPNAILSYEINDELKLEYMRKHFNIPSEEISIFTAQYIPRFINEALYLPKIIYEGYTSKDSISGKIDKIQLSDSEIFDSKSINFLYELFNKLYFTKNNETISLLEEDEKVVDNDKGDFRLSETTFGPVYINDNSIKSLNYNEKNYKEIKNYEIPDEYINREEDFIIDACKELSGFLGETLMISLTESEAQLVKFLKGVIEYFISYTSQVYSFKYIKSYNSRDENLQVLDRITAMHSMQDLDSFFYDESLQIDLSPKN